MIVGTTATVNISASAANTLINLAEDGTSTPELSIQSGGAVNLSGTGAGISVGISGTPATGVIDGSLTLAGSATSLRAWGANSVTFNSGASMSTLTGYTGPVIAVVASTANIISFASGASFTHNAGASSLFGTFPTRISMASGSTFYQRTSAGFRSDATYGNLVIQNNAAVIATNAGTLTCNTLTIESGSSLSPNGTPAATTYTINGDIVVDGPGTPLNLTNGTTNSIHIQGNITLNGTGDIVLKNSNTTAGQGIVFGGTAQTLGGSGSGKIKLNTGGIGGNTLVKNGTTLTLGRDLYISGGTFTVDGTLNCGAFLVQEESGGNQASFVLSSGGMLGIGSANGITTSTAAGSIRLGDGVVGTRTYSTGGNYVYNGIVNQTTGNGLPATVNTLTVNNSATSVTLTGSVATGTLTLSSSNTANVLTGANTLAVTNNSPGALSPLGTGYIIGTLSRAIAAASNTYNFPIGTASGFTPAAIAFSSVTGGGTLTVTTADGSTANYPASFDPAKKLNRTWTVTNSGVTGFSADAAFTYLPGDLAGAVAGNLKAYKFDAPSSTTFPTTTTGASSFTATGITSFSEFGAGEEIPVPSITLGTSPVVCAGTTSANLPYTATANDPIEYQLDYDAVAETENFADVATWTSFAGGTSGNIVLTLPGGAAPAVYNGTLTVKNAGGATSTGVPFTVTINALPTAGISGTTTICSGSSATITFSGTPNATVTYTVNGGGNQTITLDGSGSATVSTGTLSADATYALVSVETGGSPNCTNTASGTAVVTVNALPTASISGTTTICSGSSATVTFSGTPNATVTYTVNGGGNQTITLDGSGSATVSTGTLSTDATYALVSVETGGSPNCTNTASGTAIVTVNPLPTASISGSTTICSGSSATITFSGTPNATVTYTVNGGGNQTIALNGSGSATVSTGALSANATYALVSVETGGSPNCTNTASGTAIVTVNALPTAGISGTTTLCSGSSATITFSGTPNATVTYTVNGGGNQTITLDGSGSATVGTGTLSADATYALVNVETGGSPNCTNTASGTAVVTVNALPTAGISGTTTICSGSSATITFSGTPNATVTYTVNGGGNQTITLDGSGSATVSTGTLSTDATYALVSVETGGSPNCSNTATGTAIVTVNPLPTASISGSTTICSGSSATLTFSGTPNATVTYTVNGGGNQTIALDGSGSATVSTGALSANATYALVSVETGGSPNCTNTASGTAVVTVNALPTAGISGTTTICSGSSATITFSGTPNATVTYTVNSGSNQTIALDGSGSATVGTGTLSANATYALVSVETGGSPNCSNTTSGTAIVTVRALPTAGISGTATVCNGGSATITFSGTPNATVTYTVNGGGNQTIALNGSGSATVSTGTLSADATYALVSVETGGSPNCSNTASGTAIVTVATPPTASISGSTTICSGSSATVTFSGTPNATVTYTVNGGGSQTIALNGSGSATVSTGTLSADATYALVSVETGGSPNCSNTATGSAVVTVATPPTASISGSTTICPGGSTTITFSGTPNATVTYTVNGGGNQTIALDGSGNAGLGTGTLSASRTYALVSVTSSGSPVCSQNVSGNALITVQDVTPPVITFCPGNVTADAAPGHVPPW